MHSLYRMYDVNDVLLYVGITSRVGGVRFGEHEDLSGWFGDVVKIEIEHRENREDLERAEKKAIENEDPKYNLRWTDRDGSHSFHHRFNRHRLKHWRKIMGLTQSELADRTGLRESLIQQYEQGRVVPPVEKLAIIGDVLGLPINAFIGTGSFPGKAAFESETLRALRVKELIK